MKIAPDDSVAKIYLNRAEEKYSRLKFDILKSTLGLLKPQSQEFADSFYQILFTDFPDVKFMFEQTDMKKQTDKLWQSLELMVENLHNPKFTDLLLKGLGATHVKYGVLPEHYPLVGGALIKAFKIHLGENWTTELEQAWLDAYSIIQSLIISGTE
jgi:hemoglobin-like flavoprotein